MSHTTLNSSQVSIQKDFFKKPEKKRPRSANEGTFSKYCQKNGIK